MYRNWGIELDLAKKKKKVHPGRIRAESKIVAHVNVCSNSCSRFNQAFNHPFPTSLSPPSSSLFLSLLNSACHCVSPTPATFFCFVLFFPFCFSFLIYCRISAGLGPLPMSNACAAPPLPHLYDAWPNCGCHITTRLHCGHIATTTRDPTATSPRCACHLTSPGTYPHAAPNTPLTTCHTSPTKHKYPHRAAQAPTTHHSTHNLPPAPTPQLHLPTRFNPHHSASPTPAPTPCCASSTEHKCPTTKPQERCQYQCPSRYPATLPHCTVSLAVPPHACLPH
jgi:hypothetical protein